MKLTISGFDTTLDYYEKMEEVWWQVNFKNEHLNTISLMFDSVTLSQDIGSELTYTEIAKKIGLSTDKLINTITKFV